LPAKLVAKKIGTGRPKAANYEQPVRSMLNRACHHFEALVVTKHAVQTPEDRDAMAGSVWDAECARRGFDYELDDDMTRIVRVRVLLLLSC
jgi:hypothetical protein